VERVLALSQLEAQLGLGEQRRVALPGWVDEQLERQAPRLAQQGLRLVWTARDEAAVDVDAALLELAFGNVLVNAIDFAPPGSALELAVNALPAEVRITLRDHGPGVPPAGFAQLGRRFFSTARPGSLVKGSGLGLAIARRVMELHGGRLAFEAAAPGLRVSLVLPR